MNKKINTLMKTAKLWAEESYCKRQKVGAVLAKDDRVLACGYNGTISGNENVCEEEKLFFDGKEINSLYDVIDKVKVKFQKRRVSTGISHLKKLRFFLKNLEPESNSYLIDENEYNYFKGILRGKKSEAKIKRLAEFVDMTEEEFLINFLKRKHNIEKRVITNEFTLHAEQNVLMYCAKNGIPTKGAELFVTLSPCKTCAKLIVQAGIRKVYFEDVYRDTSGIDFLKQFIDVEQIGEDEFSNCNFHKGKITIGDIKMPMSSEEFKEMLEV